MKNAVNFLKKNLCRNFTTGFTLIEILIAVSVFIIVISIMVGVFVRQIRINRVAVAMISMNDAMGLTFEQMSREIRTGYNFCTHSNILADATAEVRIQCQNLQSDASGDTEMQFVNSKDITVRYRIRKAEAFSAIERGIDLINNPGACGGTDGVLSADGEFCYQKITSENVYIERFNAFVEHNNQGGQVADYYPPRVTLNMAIKSSEPDVKRYGILMNMQTSISARNF